MLPCPLSSLLSLLSSLVAFSVRSFRVSGVIWSIPFGVNMTRSAHRWLIHRWLSVLSSFRSVTAALCVVLVSFSQFCSFLIYNGGNYSLFSKDKSLVFLYVRLRHRRILLLNYCLRLPRSVRSTQVREAEAALISVAVYGSAAASAPVFR